jgi:hypothetical protein
MSSPQSGRWYRRLVSLVAGVALVSGMLGAVPAMAARGGSLVQIVSPADGAVINAATVPVTIQLQPTARPPSLRVMLDFRDVTARFHRHGHTAQAVLGTKDGLVTGNNVITATVTGPAGSQSAAQVIFQANTGVVTGPAPTPPTFSLQTRVISDKAAPGSGGDYEVRIGDIPHYEPLPLPAALTCGNNPLAPAIAGVWVLALHRQNLDQDSSVDLPLCSAKDTAALGTYLGGLPDTDMVIVNLIGTGSGCCGPTGKGLGDAMAKIGAVKAEFEAYGRDHKNGTTVFSVWGIPGLPPGQAYQAISGYRDELNVAVGSPTAASINATLIPDNNGNYTLDMRDYVTFDLGPGNGTITVGGHTYPVPPPGENISAAGFHVLVLDRQTLAVVSDNFYQTAQPDSLEPGPDDAAMANDLSGLGEGDLVLVDSVGNPMKFGQQSVDAPTVAQALALFGGTPDVINSGANQPRYANWPHALVGALSPPAAYGLRPIDAPEASPVIRDGETGQLQGVLQRGTRGMWYSPASWNAPVVLDINGVQQPPTTSNYGLFSTLAQPATPWPVPVPSGPDHDGQLAAYQYLSQQACTGCNQDIRAFYSAQEETIQTWQAVIKNTTYPSNPPPFTQDQFNAVKNELVGPNVASSIGELGDVLLVDGLRDSMHTLLSDSNQMAQPALTAAYNDVKATIAPPPSTAVGSAIYDIIEVVQAVTDISAALEQEVPGLSEVLGLVASIVGGVNDLTDDPNGAREDQLGTTVANLGQQAAADFAASLTSLDETFADIFGDYGRLSVVADGLQNHPGSWDTSGKEGALVTTMTNAMKIGFYRALIPIVYSALETPDLPTSDPAEFCAPPDASILCPFNPFSTDNNQPYVEGTSAYTYPVNEPVNGWPPRFDMTVVGKTPVAYLQHDASEHGTDPFPAVLMNDLTNAGYYPGWFFRRFPLTRHLCKRGDFDPPDCAGTS